MFDLKKKLDDLRKNLNKDHVDKTLSELFTSKEIQQERLKICYSCERFQTVLGVCVLCNCFMKLKTSKKNSRCPLNKWMPVK